MHNLSTPLQWLNWINERRSVEIELGLDRITVVADRLDLRSSQAVIVMIGGTNGKGSTVAGLESIYGAQGYQVGAFTSPMLLTPNEQVRINGKPVSDQLLCQGFTEVISACGETSLSVFEIFTLVALWVFKQHHLDVLLLEVGLGGRLDAVNIMDADVSIVTSIDLDHMAWLGDTREKIASEKAPIFRKNKPAICGDPHPPQSLIDYAKKIDAILLCQSRDFFYQEHPHTRTWSFRYQSITHDNLPLNSLFTQNMAVVLMAVTILQLQLPVDRQSIDIGLRHITLPARIQVVKGEITRIFDVAHNPASVALLTERLKKFSITGKIHAVFSMLADKDIKGSLASIYPHIAAWYIAPLETKRSVSVDHLQTTLNQLGNSPVYSFQSISDAYDDAFHHAKKGDCILAFGSFHTIAALVLNPRANS